MEDADDPSSKDEDSAPEEDQHYYGALQTHLEKLLPFINQIINNSERLNIVPTSLSNLRRVYDLVGGKRLQVHWLKMCKNIFYDLHKMHGTQLNYYLPPDFKTSWMQETKFNDKVNNLSSNVKCTSNKSNQKQNSESKLSNKIPGTSYENIVNNQMDCLEVLTPNIENTIDKNFANVKIGESSCSKNVVNNSMLAKNYPPELLDSYIRLNKIVGISVNAAIAKCNEREIEKTKNSYTDRDLQIKRSMTNNKSKKDYSCPEINVEDITVNIPSNFNKNGLDSESEQNSILMDHTDQNKPKKQNKYSKEKEFEKNVKDATDNLSDDVWSLKRKTRRNWMNKAKIYKTLKLNNSKPKFKKDIAAKSCKILEFGECSKNLDNVSIPNLKDVSGQIEIGHNMISSPSKEQSGVVHFTTTEILCKSREENIVSSDEVYSTTDIIPNIKEKNLIEMFKNPKFMNIISILLQDQNNLEKFKKFLDVSDDNINDDSLKKKDILFKEQLEIRETKKVKKKKNLNKKSSKERKNEILNIILDDNNLNQAENIGKTNKKNSHFNELNKGNTNSGNINGHLSTDHHKLKSKECYRHFEILKDKSNPESKELNNCTAKLDKHIKRSEICNSDSSSKDKQTNNKPIIVEKTRKIKSKKPFLGPLSVKLARQKMEIELKNHRNKREIKNQLEFETKKVKKGSKSIDGFDKKGKLKSETLTKSINNDEPNVLIFPFQNSKPCDDETNCNKPVEQNSNISTLVVNKPKIKKGRLSEIELLHADISKMFDCESVYASNIRQCRIYKQIDYVNTNEDMSKKKRTSNIEQLVTKDSKNDFVRSVRKPKKTVKESTIKLNTKEQFVKKSMANKTLPPVVNTTVLNKKSNKQPSIIVEKTREIKFKKPFLGPLSVKLARQKMEIKLKNHRNKREIKNQLDFETKKVRRGSKSIDGFDKKGKLKSETLTRSINNDEPNVLICPFQNSKPCDDETNCNKPVEQNSNISTLVVNKPKIKKGRLSEIELLHADISKMFDCESVYASNIRQCRIYKQLDYVNTNEDMSKKKRTSNIEQLVTKDSKNDFVLSVRKPKKTVKESTIKLNTKEQFVKKSMANKTSPPVVKTTVLNKKSNKQPSIIVEKTREIKSKKPFLGPLSVKLARQKMEIELKNHRNKREIKNQLDFETKKVRRGSKSIDGFDKKGKLKSETLTRSINNDEPNVLICPFQNSKPCDDETNCNKPVEQNSNISTLVVNKPKIKKGRLSEIELLHADISKMFDCESVYASNIRQCRIYKQIDYVNTNEDMSKKKRTSNIEQLVTNDSKNDFVCSVRKPKKNVKKSTIKLNTKEQFVKKSMANKTLPPVVKTTVLNKMSNKQPSIINKSLPELSTYENLLDLTIDTNSPELTINENLPESNIDENLPESVYDKTHVLVHQSVFHTNISKIHIVQLDDRACENPKEFKEFVLPYKSKVVKTVKQKITQEQPNDTNDFVSSLMIQENTSLKRKHCSTIERDELDIKIIELIPNDSLNTEIYPQFIQPNMRYECSIPLCTFTGKTDDILKEHISILHPTYHYYKCPHCLPQCIISNAVEQNQIGFHLMHHGSNLYRCQYCDYIDFNRVEMRTHMKNTHLLDITSSVQSNIIVIRQFMLEDDSIDRYTKNDIIAHVVMAHKVCWTSSSPSKKKNIAHETKVLVLYRTLLG